MVPDFPTKNSSFIGSFIEAVSSGSADQMIQWFQKNRENFTKDIFFDPNSNWNDLEAEDAIYLRLFAPDGIFVPEMESGFLAKVGGNKKLSAIADLIFNDDFHIVNHLPEELSAKRGEIVVLLNILYTKGVRRKDPRVVNMLSK